MEKINDLKMDNENLSSAKAEIETKYSTVINDFEKERNDEMNEQLEDPKSQCSRLMEDMKSVKDEITDAKGQIS